MIHIYDIGNENFEGNGNAILTPISCSHKQVAGGGYDIELVHAIDEGGKWEHIVPGAIVRAPVPKEVIENAFSGYASDIYKTTVEAALREGPTEPTSIVYPTWSITADYAIGAKVSWQGKAYQCTYYDETSAWAHIAPPSCNWWKQIPNSTTGDAALATLPAGTELYLIESYDATWYKMSTYYGLEGYIKKSQVTFYKHLTPEEVQPRIITEQLFRLREPTIDNEANTVTVTGMHVSYDLNGILVQNVNLSQVTPAMAIGRIVEGFMMEYRGTIATNITDTTAGTYTGTIKGKNGMFALLDPDKGVVAQFDAKFTRDNWDLFIMKKTTADRGFRIRYGVNMRGVNWKKSSSSLITRIVPVAKDEKGEELYLPEKWVDSSHINDYPVINMDRMSVSGQVGKDKGKGDDSTWTEADLLDEMRAKAGERFTVEHVDEITEEVTIQFEQLGDTYEYRQLKDMETVLLYDTVKAYDERIGLEKTLYVTELEYDCVRKRVTGVKLSNKLSNVKANITGYNVQNNSITPAKLTDEVAQSIVDEMQGIIPEYSDQTGNSGSRMNSKTQNGFVKKGEGQANKVWKTDADGNPDWRTGEGASTWDTVTMGTPSSGSLINGSYLVKNDGIKLAVLNVQINGNAAGATMALNISIQGSINKPIYGYNDYNNTQVDCYVDSSGILHIIQSCALLRVYAVLPIT